MPQSTADLKYTFVGKEPPQRKEERKMSLTRKMLKAMGIEDDKIDQIIEAHTETVNGLKDDVQKYKVDAEKLPNVQKELDDIKAVGDGGWEEKAKDWENKYNNLVADNTAKATAAAKEKAVRAYYESKGITGDNLTIAMMGSGDTLKALEMDGEKIKDSSALDALITGAFSKLVATTNTNGAQTKTPPANNQAKTYTAAEIKGMTAAEINKNWDAVKASLQTSNGG
jgi:hypothetical protein